MLPRMIRLLPLALIACALCVIGLGGCSDDETGTLTAPTILSSTPADGATGIVLLPTIEIVFSMAMDHAAVETATSFESGRSPVAYSTAWDGNSYEITPGSDLEPGTLHTITLAASAEGDNGEVLEASWSISFTTILAPVVLSSEPAEGATQVDEHPEIVVTFSQTMDQASVAAATSLSDDRANVPISMFWMGNSLRIEPQSSLAGDSEHTLRILSGAKNADGVNMHEAWFLTFRTVTDWPVVVETYPATGATDVIRNVLASLTFSRMMESVSTEAAISIDPSANMTFESWAMDSRVLPISFPDGLAESTAYTITVAQTAEAQNGEPMQSDFTYTFTTGTESDTTAPSILSWSPASGTTGVASDIGTVGVTFSEPVDPESVQPTSIDGRFVMAMNIGDVEWNADFSAFTISLANLPPGAEISVDLGPFSDRAGNMSTDPAAWSITVAGDIDWFPSGQNDRWSMVEMETDDQGNPQEGMIRFFEDRVEDIVGDEFSIVSYEEQPPRVEVASDIEDYERFTDRIEFLGFSEYDSGSEEWFDALFSAPITWLMLPPAVGQLWDGSTTFLMQGETFIVDYAFEMIGFDDLELFSGGEEGGEGGPDNILLPGCAHVRLDLQIFIDEDPELVLQQETTEDHWFCPGVGLVRSEFVEEDHGEDPSEISYDREEVIFWSVGQ